MKVVIFGTGLYYEKRKAEITRDVEIVGFIDNNPALWGSIKDGVEIFSPHRIFEFTYDAVLLMSTKADEMEFQLLQMGICEKSIWRWDLFCACIKKGDLQIYGIQKVKGSGKKILIITGALGYHGGAMAAFYVTKQLQEKGYEVVLAAPGGDNNFIEEVTAQGIVIAICSALKYIHEEEMEWIRKFDMVIVNTFPMMVSAQKISKELPVLWWIHECSDRYTNIYEKTQREFKHYFDQEEFFKINIYAVSNVAGNNFNYYYPNAIKNTLMYGIPDKSVKNRACCGSNSKIVFAVIGNICERKAQRVWVEAIKLLSNAEKEKCEFWLIGYADNTSYTQEVLEMSLQEKVIKIYGQMTREEIENTYQGIDVVVCPSLEETVSITITEGMMYEKICITTDATGIAEYIEQGRNGLICEAGNKEDLCDKMRWVIKNIHSLEDMKKKARETYEQTFSMEKFSERLIEAVESTIGWYNNGCNSKSNAEKITY